MVKPRLLQFGNFVNFKYATLSYGRGTSITLMFFLLAIVTKIIILFAGSGLLKLLGLWSYLNRDFFSVISACTGLQC